MSAYIHRIRQFWLAPELKLVHLRRERRMLLLSSLMTLVMGSFWGLFFATGGYWIIVAMDLVLILGSASALELTRRNQVRGASMMLFATLASVVCFMAAVLDVPSALAPRTTHLYLLPLSVAALLTFQDKGHILRHGPALACLLAFAVLAASPATPLPGYSLPDSVRVPGSWIQAVAALSLMYGLLHIMHTDATERSALEGELVQALAQHQFLLQYQPQVDADGKVFGAEALLRWAHPERGLIMPNEFIGTAEQSGLILPIGNWVLHSACAQLREWAEDPALRHLCVAVNISQKQFRQHDFVQQVLAAIEHHQIDPARLELELTESMLVQDVTDITQKMSALRSRGVTFSLDDFGTGFSSLSLLKRLPLNKLKIDQSFVCDVLSDSHSAAIVRTVIALGQSLSLGVIAEGVENEEQRQFLRDNACLEYQGYLFGRALSARALEAFVRERQS